MVDDDRLQKCRGMNPGVITPLITPTLLRVVVG